jgi:hypothetical protein
VYWPWQRSRLRSDYGHVNFQRPAVGGHNTKAVKNLRRPISCLLSLMCPCWSF